MKSIKAWSAASILFALAAGAANAQAPEISIDLTSTDVLSQGQTGTCWSFSTTSFLESEAHRVTGNLHDFSEMAAVRVVYPEKVQRYVRYQGKHQFGPGGLSHDVTHAAAVYGLVPQSVCSVLLCLFHGPVLFGCCKNASFKSRSVPNPDQFCAGCRLFFFVFVWMSKCESAFHLVVIGQEFFDP